MANPSPHPMNQPKSPMPVNRLSRIAMTPRHSHTAKRPIAVVSKAGIGEARRRHVAGIERSARGAARSSHAGW